MITYPIRREDWYLFLSLSIYWLHSRFSLCRFVQISNNKILWNGLKSLSSHVPLFFSPCTVRCRHISYCVCIPESFFEHQLYTKIAIDLAKMSNSLSQRNNLVSITRPCLVTQIRQTICPITTEMLQTDKMLLWICGYETFCKAIKKHHIDFTEHILHHIQWLTL